jgi:hypothetical protein
MIFDDNFDREVATLIMLLALVAMLLLAVLSLTGVIP